jgi:hypothetical protein
VGQLALDLLEALWPHGPVFGVGRDIRMYRILIAITLFSWVYMPIWCVYASGSLLLSLFIKIYDSTEWRDKPDKLPD